MFLTSGVFLITNNINVTDACDRYGSQSLIIACLDFSIVTPIPRELEKSLKSSCRFSSTRNSNIICLGNKAFLERLNCNILYHQVDYQFI